MRHSHCGTPIPQSSRTTRVMHIRERFSMEDKMRIIAWLCDHPYESYNSAARVFGVHKKTIYNWLVRSPELEQRVRTEQAMDNKAFIKRVMELARRMAVN